MTNSDQHQQGYILLLGMVVMAILITMSAVVWGYTMMQIKQSKTAVNKVEAWHIAEAGIDKAISQLNTNSSFTGETANMTGGTYVTSVSSINSNNKQITSTAYIPNNISPESKVTVKVNVTVDLSAVAFNFGVQVGAGGLVMDNNSSINGNVFSNGDITGSNGTVTGDATVAGGGSPTADQQCTTNNANFSFNQSDRVDVAQKFIPTVSGPLTKISVYVKKTGSPSDITVRIVTDNSGKPSKTQIGGNGTVSSSGVTTNYGWADASFATTPTLTSGTSYWLILDTSSTTTNYYIWANDSTGSSCNGSGSYSDNWNRTTPVWTASSADFNMKTYMGGVPTKLTNIRVNGNARANILQSCSVGGNAYYATTNTCTVSGTPNPGTADTAQQAMPVSQAQIDEWESVALAGGTQAGPYTVNGVVTMGPKKITGDLTINGTLYLTGPIWVEGNISMSNNAAVRIDNSLGNSGTVLLADKPSDQANTGLVSISNNVVIAGNNRPGSYPMILTTKSGTAMTISNNAAGAIFYAANGTVDVSNNGGGNQITGYGIHLNNNSSVTYSTGLQSATFSNGPGGAWAIVPGTYILLGF